MDSTFVGQLVQQALPALALALATVITTVISAASGRLFTWLMDHAKTQRQKDVLGRVKDGADEVVRDLSNTVVDAIKKASADGTIGAEDRQKIKDAAVANLKKYLGQVNVDAVVKVMGYKTPEELESALATMVESAVFRMRLQQEAVKAAAPVAPIAIPKVVTPA